MPDVINLAGRKIGKLSVICQVSSKTKHRDRKWRCRCDCGRKVTVLGGNLRSGHTKSCGCLLREKITTHGMSKTRLWDIWSKMKSRCADPDTKYYYAKGIKVSKAWDSFERFYIDMGQKYFRHVRKYGERNTSIDRINSARGYCKSNCRWATSSVQNNNLPQTRKFLYKKKMMTLTELATKFGLSRIMLNKRLERGWSLEKSLTTLSCK